MRQKIKSGNSFLMKSLVLISFIFGMGLDFVFAADKNIEVRMSVTPPEVGVGEPFNVVIEVSSGTESQVDSVSTPEILGAQFLGQSQSRRINAGVVMTPQGIEHKTVQTAVYTFQYTSDKVGLLVVPASVVVVDGKNYSLNAGRVSVVQESLASQARKSRQQMLEEDDFFNNDPFERIDKMEEAFNKLLQRQFGGGGSGGFQAIPNINPQDAFAIVAEVDKTTVFKGEQITATWYLYTKAGVREIDTLKYPTLKGFWKEDIELATLLSFQPAELNGQQYNKALLASYALFPIESGKAVIDGYKAKVVVVGGFGKTITNTKSSSEIPILVKPLPDAPQDAVFSGAVGEFQMKSSMDSSSVVAHQPFVVKVRIDGRGNAKQFELPNLQLPPSIELYDIKKESKYFKDGLSYKEFEITLVPREEGTVKIPAVATTVFNPKTEKYETLSTTDFEVRVMAGSGQQTMAASRLQKQEKEQSQPLVPLMSWQEHSSGQWVPELPAFAVVFGGTGLGFCVFGLLAAGFWRREQTLKEAFQERVKLLNRLWDQKKWRELGIEATNLVNFVLGKISGDGGADVHIELLMDKLPPSVRQELGLDLKNIMDRFYILGFGPDLALEQAVKNNTYEKDVKSLEKLLAKAIELSSAGDR